MPRRRRPDAPVRAAPAGLAETMAAR